MPPRPVCRLALRLAGLVALIAAAGSVVSATPLPLDHPHHDHESLDRRDCSTYCGASGQYCCAPGEACTTLSGNLATCVAGGYYGLYTTTWTETRTYTSTIMTHWLPAPEPTAGVDCVPADAQQQACGPICCAGWQTCAFRGQCSLRPGYLEPSPIVVTSDGAVTTRYSAPYRITGTTTVTGTGLPPTTAESAPAHATHTPDGEAIGPDGSTDGGGLSPGAIAGIVIGTLAGVALLLLLCFCCIARGLWHALEALIFGRKRRDSHDRNRSRVQVVDETYIHRGRTPSNISKDRHSGWVGSRPGPASSRRNHLREKKSKSQGNWWLALVGAISTLLIMLNLKKDKRPPPRKAPPPSSYYSDSYYYDYTDSRTSPSECPLPRSAFALLHTDFLSPSR
ncbi:hypothetical protein CDD82_6486 [Ophiocordyceps australis]|uniref:Mid2 domain-containing protein n=1 Tax=Ophiocordyceps australis TaxID=1399860 RepID=A0A2C5YVW6_9HYPO|nr:hypothetical protein CDD82_6486 [Ophiocordyceps australis]